MEIAFAVVFGIIIIFGFVILFGAPYLPTLKPQIKIALDLLDLQAGQTLIEVGSGDGRVLRAAAERGWNAVGYELNPVLVLYSRWHTRRYKKQVHVIWGNALHKEWPQAEGIYIFGINRIMPALYKKIVQSINCPVKVASFGFQIAGSKPVTTKQGIYLYSFEPGQKGLQSR